MCAGGQYLQHLAAALRGSDDAAFVGKRPEIRAVESLPRRAAARCCRYCPPAHISAACIPDSASVRTRLFIGEGAVTNRLPIAALILTAPSPMKRRVRTLAESGIQAADLTQLLSASDPKSLSSPRSTQANQLPRSPRLHRSGRLTCGSSPGATYSFGVAGWPGWTSARISAAIGRRFVTAPSPMKRRVCSTSRPLCAAVIPLP
jgi:hypothetical protein